MSEAVRSGYRMLLKNTQYRRYLLGNLFGRFGDSVDSIAYGWMVYALTGSRAWLSVIFGVNALPTILLQPFAGVWVERMDKKRVVVVCDIGRGVIVALTGLLFALGWLAPWHLLALTLLNSTLEAFRSPAGTSLLPRLLEREHFDYAMGLNGTLSRVAELIGLGAAGALIGLLGVGGTLMIDAAMFTLSALLLIIARLKPAAARTDGKQSFWQSAKEGLACLTGNKTILWMCLLGCIINPLVIPFNTLMTAFIQENLSLGVQALSASSTAVTLLMGIGSFLYPQIGRRIRLSRIICCSLALVGLSYGALTLAPLPAQPFARLAVLVGASAVMGFAASQASTAVQTTFIKTVPESHLGRVGSLFNAMAMGITPLSSFAVAGIVTLVPIHTLYGIMGILILLLAVWLGLSKTTRRLGEDDPHAAAAAQTTDLCG